MSNETRGLDLSHNVNVIRTDKTLRLNRANKDETSIYVHYK